MTVRCVLRLKVQYAIKGKHSQSWEPHILIDKKNDYSIYDKE